MAESEVARIMQQIELTCQAMQLGLHGYAEVASHQIINHKYKTLGQYMQQLDALVGEEEATNMVADTYIRMLG
jgi:hypothetical protein